MKNEAAFMKEVFKAQRSRDEDADYANWGYNDGFQAIMQVAYPGIKAAVPAEYLPWE